jgi:membrane protein
MNRLIQHIKNFISKIYHHQLVYFWFHPIYTVLADTINNYNKRRVSRLGAALAYYTIFSLPAIIIIIVGLVGFLLGDAAVKGEIYGSIVDFVGQDAALQIEAAVKNTGTIETNWWATVLGISLLMFVATGLFYALQEALNMIFQVREIENTGDSILQTIINRLLSLGMIFSMGGLLIVSIIMNAVLLELSNYIRANEQFVISKIPATFSFLIKYIEYFTDYFLVALNFVLSIVLIMLFFILLYRILPAVKIPWRYVLSGALFTSALFWVGELLIGLYLKQATVISAYGAAGSLIVVLVWVYYSAQIIFLGAEFIRALTSYRGYTIMPKAFAVRSTSATNNTAVLEPTTLEDEEEENPSPIDVLTPIDEPIEKTIKDTIQQEPPPSETKD